jgi:predicted ATPase/class 3 adenylate cyclase
MADGGSLTFLFTDIEESTRLLQQLGARYEDVFVRHLELITGAVHAAGGRIDHSTGDGVLAVFGSAEDAVRAAAQAQRALVEEAWPPDAAVRVRMGLHSGPVRTVGGELVGLAVHVAARVMSAAHGRQILLSGTTAALVPGLESRDLGVHRLRGVIDEHRLLQVIGPDLPDDFPPPRTAGARAHNLPTLRTSFVGRNATVADLLDRLRTDRLTTLVGPPGVGKTRLALEAAEAGAPSFADGVWFADLTGTDGQGVAGAVAAAVGAPAEPGGSVTTTLSEHLAAQRCVVLLDNCEHVTAAVADLVAKILAAAPGVHVLSTSRALVGLPGERRLDVSPLELPDGDDAGALASSPAGALLLDRALTADPTLVVDDTAALADLCREVDGIPLALELAAARLSDVDPADVLADLRRAGVPPGHDHHATLAATVAWSVDRLRPATRSVLARLGVFSGPFPLEAATDVAGFGTVDPEDVPDAVDTLVRRSLVAVEGGALGRRYRLLRIIA